MKQLSLIPKVFYSPRFAFRELPSDRWYLLAWLAPIYFGVARGFRIATPEMNSNVPGGFATILAIGVILGLLFLVIGAWLMQLILRLFKKRLSIKKLMNIYGYSLIPRLAVAIVGYILLAASPDQILSTTGPTPLQIVVILLGLLGILYTLFLYFYGIVVSPSEES